MIQRARGADKMRMRWRVFQTVAKMLGRVSVSALLVVLAQATAAHAVHVPTTVEWYRTAQGTGDRITSQPTVSFGADFASNTTVTINRS